MPGRAMIMSSVFVAMLTLLAGQAWGGFPGDANGDGLVDMADYSAWFNNYGKTGATLADGDFDGSGVVDMTDYSMWFNNYGQSAGQAQMCNLKIVTDANPDYSDMDSMVNSIASRWATTREKCWAMFYWNHIARRQTAPMMLHGFELTDPIRQFNDYGYEMCSTISGTNCGIFGYMGLPVKLWDICNHTVMEVMYADGIYHMHDNSLSMLYTTCDGSRLAGVQEIGVQGACAASLNVTDTGHIAKYHAVYGSSPNGFCTGADTPRSLAQMADDFWPNGLKYRYYYNNQDLGHRYVLNLRPNELYTRTYHTTGGTKDYYVPNPPPSGVDPESVNTRYHIRGNGQWAFTPALSSGDLLRNTISMTGLDVVASGTGLQPKAVNQTGEVVFKIEGANVITSIKIEGTFKRGTTSDVNAIDISVNNGLTWSGTVWSNSSTGTGLKTITITDPVNGYYEVLVKIRLMGKTAVTNAQLTTLKFTTITMVNSKTQPMLRLGRNTVYVDRGEQSGTVALWPELQNYGYRQYSVQESNVGSGDCNGYTGNIWAVTKGQEAFVVFKLDTPGNMTKFTYGGRLYNACIQSHIDFLHSFDGGATWTQSYSLTSLAQPWDVIHYETITGIPPGTKSVLIKYRWNSYNPGRSNCSIYAVRMEANYRTGDTSARPLEVTYTWKERQTNYSTVTRSHTQLVPSLPYSYVINVGGADHPVMESLRVNQQGAAGPVTYGYSDGIDVGGAKFQDRWVTFGNILSVGKSYTCNKVSRTDWGAGDPDGTKLTDGVVGSSYTGGSAMALGAIWQANTPPANQPVKITVDLGSARQCGAFRIHTFGYPWWDSMKGEQLSTAAVYTSTDNVNFAHSGTFNLNLRWKDIPVNYMWTDEETFCAHNFEVVLPAQVTARWVQFRLWPDAPSYYFMDVSEVQVLDGITYTPFDLKLAPPPAFAGGGAGGAPAKLPAAKSPIRQGRSVTPALIRKGGS